MAVQMLGIKTKFTDDQGRPLVGGSVHTYYAGTSLPQDTFSDPELTVPNTNPVNLDDTGSANIFLKGTYRVRVFDSNGVFVEEQDNVDQLATAAEVFKNKGGLNAANERIDTLISEVNSVKEKTIVVESISGLSTINNPKDGLRVYVKSYHAGLGKGGGYFIYDSSKTDVNDGLAVFNGWVRQISNGITPEMAGAKGDGVANDLVAFEKCLEYGGKILLDNSKEYFLELTGMSSYIERDFLTTSNSVQLIGVGKGRAKVIFKHDAPNGSPSSLIIGRAEGEGHIYGNILANIEFLGNPTRGIADKTKRARGVNMTGAANFIVSNCKFSTMQTHSLGINRAGGTDWFDKSNPDSANTAESVLTLQALSSKNGLIENCEVEHVGSNGLAIFGGSNIKVDGFTGEMDLTAKFNNIILTDDASDSTPLENYAINDNIHISRVVTNGRIALGGSASGSITKCTAGTIVVVSYNFDQQKNNFGEEPNHNGTSTHLTKPFLWMDHIERGVRVEGNIVNTLHLSSAYVVVNGNFLYTTKADDKLVTLANKGVSWAAGEGGSYFDYLDPSTSNDVSNNTFTVGHTGATLVGYDAAAGTNNATILDNTIKLINGITTYTYHQSTNIRAKKSSSIIDVGNTVTKDINYHVNVGQGLLTQGVGSNFIKTFANIWDSSTGDQDIVAFTAATSNVYILLNILDDMGRITRKKITVEPDNTLILEDLDDGLRFVSGVFKVKSLSDGSRVLYIVSMNLSLCIDITGVVKYGTGTFLAPPSRRRSDG